MYDMTKFITRYFKIKLKNQKIIDVEPPKLKVFREILKLSKNISGNDEIDNLVRATSLALSKNKQNYKVSPEMIEETMNYDEIYNLLVSYFNWVNETTNSKN